MTPSDFDQAMKYFAKDYLNPKKLNMVIMMPREKLVTMHTLKGLVSHGFKLFLQTCNKYEYRNKSMQALEDILMNSRD